MKVRRSLATSLCGDRNSTDAWAAVELANLGATLRPLRVLIRKLDDSLVSAAINRRGWLLHSRLENFNFGEQRAVLLLCLVAAVRCHSPAAKWIALKAASSIARRASTSMAAVRFRSR